MNSPQPTPTRKRWLFTFGSFVALVFIYGAICALVEHTRPPNLPVNLSLMPLRLCFIAVALVSLAVSVIWLRVRVDGKIGSDSQAPLLSTTQFLTDSIIALSFSNACATYGLALFFVGAKAQEYSFFALGTLLVDFLLVLPRGLQFWTATEKQSNL